jgi:hypothetical protein
MSELTKKNENILVYYCSRELKSQENKSPTFVLAY